MVIRKEVLEQIRLVLVSQERSVNRGDRTWKPRNRVRGGFQLDQGRLSVPKEA